jgi:hypothetical protein
MRAVLALVALLSCAPPLAAQSDTSVSSCAPSMRGMRMSQGQRASSFNRTVESGSS